RKRRPRLLERARAAARLVPSAVRIVDADAKRNRSRLLAQYGDLTQALQHGSRAVRQHQARFELRRVAQDVDEVFDDERLTARERELLDAERDSLVDERLRLRERDAAEPPVAGLRAFQAERARQVAGRACVKPDLAQRVRLDVAPRLAGGRELQGL